MNDYQRTALIDCTGIYTIEEFFQRYLDSTNPRFPANFGRNLDALWDAIEGGGPGCPVDFDHLHFINLQQFVDELGGPDSPWYQALRRVAGDATEVKLTLSLGGTS
ncbi:Barstar (barnase inhibitor) [Phyllobacterium sp. YR620]|uniref:barstar family protein n=1 Tax=Phyllobacterium sp. YR620 TaxID=1881066 RepID=UPI000883D89A|nr:barstar family protein [Phyllobacterium sp. YR620]SDP91826.1 Barstar (barnase inhibitor) [Phyllobacterium sp. YR620]